MQKAASNLSHPTQPGSRTGLTLLELLIVLGILVIAGAMAFPALQSTLQTRNMEKSAEFVREKLDEGRTRAIETGFVYQFRYEPGGSQFVIVPDLRELAEGADGSRYVRFSGEIFNDISFQETLDSPGVGETLDQEWFEGMPDSFELMRTGWSKPVEFTFEGQAEDSTFYLIDEEERSIKMTIRGLTGGVRVGRIQGAAE